MKEGPISSSSNFNHVPVMGKEIIQSLKELPKEFLIHKEVCFIGS